MSSGPEWGAAFAAASTDGMNFYDEIMVPRLFEPWAELLLDEVNPQRGQAVLDVACGPGTVARLAALRVGPSGRVTGCDLSPAMLEIARSKPPVHGGAPVDFRECPADSLSVPDRDFDLLTCQQGMQFFPNRPAAVAEMRRALREGGQLGVAVWCEIEECPPFAALGSAVARVLGTESANSFRSGPWGFGDAASLRDVVSDGGFDHVTVRRREFPVVFEGGPGQLMLTLHAASVASTLATLTAAELAEFAAAVEDAARPITFDGVIRSHASAHLLTATVGERSG
jgi:SAM-dependent methyltransferase